MQDTAVSQRDLTFLAALAKACDDCTREGFDIFKVEALQILNRAWHSAWPTMAKYFCVPETSDKDCQAAPAIRGWEPGQSCTVGAVGQSCISGAFLRSHMHQEKRCEAGALGI